MYLIAICVCRNVVYSSLNIHLKYSKNNVVVVLVVLVVVVVVVAVAVAVAKTVCYSYRALLTVTILSNKCTS